MYNEIHWQNMPQWWINDVDAFHVYNLALISSKDTKEEMEKKKHITDNNKTNEQIPKNNKDNIYANMS